jgi:hypothetical protein
LKLRVLAASMLAITMASAAHAGEPRPWLCRDKPVFSSSRPMRYQLSTTSRWELFFMQFSPGGGHDGFDITKTARGSSSGQLAAGQYFAVALREAGGSWVCPVDVEEQPRATGAISNLCFASEDGGCNAKLIVTPDGTTSP